MILKQKETRMAEDGEDWNGLEMMILTSLTNFFQNTQWWHSSFQPRWRQWLDNDAPPLPHNLFWFRRTNLRSILQGCAVIKITRSLNVRNYEFQGTRHKNDAKKVGLFGHPKAKVSCLRHLTARRAQPCTIHLFSFVCLLSHCRPRDGALENYFFQIQMYPRGNE